LTATRLVTHPKIVKFFVYPEIIEKAQMTRFQFYNRWFEA
jgi:hypothetical protein